MRIAPKPKPGQEISLENILGTPNEPGGAFLKVGYKPSGDRVEDQLDYWTLYNVSTLWGSIDLHLRPRINESYADYPAFLKANIDAKARGDWRAASAPELWAILRHIKQRMLDKVSLAEEELLPKVKEFLKEEWDKGITTFTEIRYAGTGEDTIVHLPGTAQEKVFIADVKTQERDASYKRRIAETVLGTSLLSTLSDFQAYHIAGQLEFVSREVPSVFSNPSRPIDPIPVGYYKKTIWLIDFSLKPRSLEIKTRPTPVTK